jgi:hypothetical protein
MNRDHITIHQLPGSKTVTIYCGKCTGALHLALPMKATEITTAIEQYSQRHDQCQTKKA